MMKKNNKKVWVGAEQLTNHPAYVKAANNEFTEVPPITEQLKDDSIVDVTSNRRDFLKYLGFGVGTAVVAAGCDIPVRKSIPYVNKPEQIVPGVATYYASSFVSGGDYCAVLVKTREGRPIKIEGNSFSKVTKGGTSARAQASVLSLYDTSRFQGPVKINAGSNEEMSWADLDKAVMAKLKGGNVRIIANTVMSPSSKAAMRAFAERYAPNSKLEDVLVMYDPISSSAILEANEESFGQKVVPDYHFDKAKVIVSFDADFLGTWISPIEYAADYIVNRRIDDVKKTKMSRHYQIESHVSLTGSNADHRILVKPSAQGAAIATLYNALASKLGFSSVSAPKMDAKTTKKINAIAKDLLANRGTSLVVSGSNNKGEQILINAINAALGNYGHTLEFTNASLQRQGTDQPIQRLIKDMKSGSVSAVFIMDGANPAYDLPNSSEFVEAIKKVGLSVSFAGLPTETTAVCQYVAPTHHYLESWGDVEPKRGHLSLIQPTIQPIFAAVGKEGTRQAEESLLIWAGSEMLDTRAEQPYLEFVKQVWRGNMFGSQGKYTDFQAFWDATLHDGVFEMAQDSVEVTFAGDVNKAASMIRKPGNSELEVSFFETVNMGNGTYANNPWLQEMPDPVHRGVWGNYLAIPIKWNGEDFEALNGLNKMEIYSEADIVELTANQVTNRISAIRQFGQMAGTVATALGYGRSATGKRGKELGEQVGTNVYPMLTFDANGNIQYYAEATVSNKVATDKEFAFVQYHHSMGLTTKGDDGEVMKDTKTGKDFNIDEKAIMILADGFQGGLVDRSVLYHGDINEIDETLEKIKHKRAEAAELNSKTLYPYEEYKEKFYSQGQHWAMHIDMNSCIGCGACQVACVAENNVPVVGKHEVFRHHEMTWLRIDRYFYGDYETPNVAFQPMLCQHCDNAPCENVCPVAATSHSSEGLNQMAYNRCIGTRYCANNCPYKVRRFNWLDYTTADLFPINEPQVADEDLPFGADNLTRMVLNPDVTIRSRGVIEKCSFCVQRIQEGKLNAKKENRELGGNEVKTACQTACPTQAIVFGDDNQKDSHVVERIERPLTYRVLEEINVQSSIFYGARVTNKNEELEA